MTTGRLGYNSVNDRYGLLVSDLWEHSGFHCGEGLEAMVDGKWQMANGYRLAWKCAGTMMAVMTGISLALLISVIWNMSEQGYKE